MTSPSSPRTPQDERRTIVRVALLTLLVFLVVAAVRACAQALWNYSSRGELYDQVEIDLNVT